MTKCKSCKHEDGIAYFRPQDKAFINAACWPGESFHHVLVRFVDEYERLRQIMEVADEIGVAPPHSVIESFKKYHDILNHIELDYCKECSHE